ncbi:MAG: hypothetical protein M1822_002764 [Bathelium mastoideum]|nr:MAG: hypothetical protein M1822_002764 [Bathelium mastoideum]
MSGLELLGAVAAALQLGDGALESCLATVKYFAKLKNAPRDILVASNDLQNLQQTFRTIEQALRGVSADVIAPVELRAIEDSINVAKELCLQLERKLQPLQLGASDGAIQKARKAMSSLRQSGDLSAISTRIKAAESSVNALLTTQAITAVGKLKDHGSMEHRSIEDQIRDSSTQSIQQHQLVEQRILNLSRQTAHEHQVVDQGIAESLAQGRQTHELVETRFQHLSDQNANQYRLIEQRIDRSEQALFTKMAATSALPERTLGNLNSPSTIIRPDESLTGSDVVQLISSVEQMREAFNKLASKPGALADVCEESRSHGILNPTRSRRSSGFPFSLPQCLCRGSTKTSQTQWKLGPLSVLSVGRVMHQPTCPLFVRSRSRKRFEIRLPLTLIVSAAIELTFDANFGAGGNSFSSNLRYYGTVERSRSPAFALIDRYQNAPEAEIEVGPGQYIKDLLELFNELLKMLAREPSLAALKDVQGKTLLLDVTDLIRFFALSDEFMTLDLGYLNMMFSCMVNTLIQYGVDKDAKTLSNRSALKEALLLDLVELRDPQRDFQPAVRLIQAGCTLDDSPGCFRCGWKDIEIIEPILGQYPEYAEAIGFEPLEVAILQRSKAQTEKLLASRVPPNGQELSRAFTAGIVSYQKPWPSSEDIKDIVFGYLQADLPMKLCRTPSTPLECTIGWRVGVKALLEAGANGYFALGRAAAMLDLESLDLLLDSDCSLFSLPTIDDCARWSKHGRPVFLPNIEFDSVSLRFGGFWTSKDPEVISCVVNALCDRRTRLQRLAKLHLSPEELHTLGFPGENPLDFSAFSVYQALLSRNVPVPPSLWPGIQHTIYSVPGLSLAYTEALYQAGFHLDHMDLDEVRRNDIGSSDQWRLSELERFAWLARKGVRMKNMQQSWSYLHKIANEIDVRYVNKVADLMPNSTLPNQELEPDACKCHCSSNGCLPIKIFLRACDPISGELSRREAMDLWLDALRPAPKTLQTLNREICRLEIFDRLDMAHTCCICPRLSEPERAELQSEDRFALEQLELIMEAYDQHQEAHPGPIALFWNDWWDKIDCFLPESESGKTGSIWDRENWHWNERICFTSDWERQSLQLFPTEYRNMDMLDVISLELFNETSDELDRIPQIVPEREARDEQQHRLDGNEA